MDDLLTEAKDCQAYWQPRTKKIKAWYDLARLVDELATRSENTGLETTVSNRPRAFRNLALHLLSAGDVIKEIPIDNSDRAQRAKKSDSERALTSLWREKDVEQIEAGEMLWRRQFADFAFMTGYYAVLYGVFKDKDGSPYFRSDILNPANVFQRWVNRKLIGCYHIHQLSAKEIEYLAKVKKWKWNTKSQSSGTIYQCYKLDGSDVLYGVYVGETLVEEPKPLEGMTKIPLLTAPVGGFADRGTDIDTKQYIERIGESLLEPISEVVKRTNRTRSFVQQITKKIATPEKFDITLDGQGVVDEQNRSNYHHLHPGEDIRTVRQETSALPELNILLGQDDTEFQLATIPSVAYGTTLGLELSGYAYAQMMTAAYSSLGEINSSINMVIGIISKKWLDGFKANWTKKYKLTISGQEKGHTGYFNKEFTPDDIPDLTYVEVKGELAMPNDLIQRISAARQAIPQGDLLDDITVLSDILKQPDPELVRTRIKEAHMENSPEMEQLSKLFEMQRKYKYLLSTGKEEDTEYAELILWAINQLKAQFGFQPGQGTPRKTAGVSPEVAPPETMGIPPAMLRGLYGGKLPSPKTVPKAGGR